MNFNNVWLIFDTANNIYFMTTQKIKTGEIILKHRQRWEHSTSRFFGVNDQASE